MGPAPFQATVVPFYTQWFTPRPSLRGQSIDPQILRTSASRAAPPWEQIGPESGNCFQRGQRVKWLNKQEKAEMLVGKEHPATGGMNAAVRQRAGAAGLHSLLPGAHKENPSRSGRLGPGESSQPGAHPGFLGAGRLPQPHTQGRGSRCPSQATPHRAVLRRCSNVHVPSKQQFSSGPTARPPGSQSPPPLR